MFILAADGFPKEMASALNDLASTSYQSLVTSIRSTRIFQPQRRMK